MQLRILSLDDEDKGTQVEIIKNLSAIFEVELASTSQEMFQKLRASQFDVLLLDKHLRLEGMSGIDLIPALQLEFPDLAIIVLTHDLDFNGIPKAFTYGAVDYIIKSDALITDLNIRIPQAVKRVAKNRLLQTIPNLYRSNDCPLIGSSDFCLEVGKWAQEKKGSCDPLLIKGERWTGVETLSRLLWLQEGDSERPYVQINCSSPEFTASILFGEIDRTPTGVSVKKGAILLANGGDLVLENFDCLSKDVQKDLKDVILQKTVLPIGSDKRIPIRTRIVFTANLPSTEGILAHFDSEFYELISGKSLEIPSLSKRAEDIPHLALYCLRRESRGSNQNFRFSKAALNYLSSLSWPGNFQQLSSAIEASVALVSKANKTVIDLMDIFCSNSTVKPTHNMVKKRVYVPTAVEELSEESYKKCLYDAEKAYLSAALKLCDWDFESTAKAIGLSVSSIYKKIDHFQLSKQLSKKRKFVRRTKRVLSNVV